MGSDIMNLAKKKEKKKKDPASVILQSKVILTFQQQDQPNGNVLERWTLHKHLVLKEQLTDKSFCHRVFTLILFQTMTLFSITVNGYWGFQDS